MSVSPISQNLSNPSVFFSHTGNNFISIGGGTPAGANNQPMQQPQPQPTLAMNHHFKQASVA